MPKCIEFQSLTRRINAPEVITMGDEIKTVYIKSEWLRNFISEHGKAFYVFQVVTIVG